LRVVFYKEGDSWIAHCLEFDLAGDGATRDEALGRLAEAIALQAAHAIEHDNPSNLFSPADGKYFEMYAAGHDLGAGSVEFDAGLALLRSSAPMITGLDAREYADAEPEPALA
jgi:predicted RNase H-like HicB family nuclease